MPLPRKRPGDLFYPSYIDQQVPETSAAHYRAPRVLYDLQRLGERWTCGFRPAEMRAYLQFGLRRAEMRAYLRTWGLRLAEMPAQVNIGNVIWLTGKRS